MIIIRAIIVAIFISLCLLIISEGINKQLEKEVDRQRDLNKQILGLFQNEQRKTDTLYKIILHIRQELSLLKLKDCPKEEFKNIPFKIIEWIDLLEKSTSGDDSELHKQTRY